MKKVRHSSHHPYLIPSDRYEERHQGLKRHYYPSKQMVKYPKIGVAPRESKGWTVSCCEVLSLRTTATKAAILRPSCLVPLLSIKRPLLFSEALAACLVAFAADFSRKIADEEPREKPSDVGAATEITGTAASSSKDTLAILSFWIALDELGAAAAVVRNWCCNNSLLRQIITYDSRNLNSSGQAGRCPRNHRRCCNSPV